MTTTLGKLADALGALAIVEAHKTGERLYRTDHTGQSYRACATDAERNGWIAAWNEALTDQEGVAEMAMA